MAHEKQHELFTESYSAHSQELLRRARSLVNDREQCEDIVQEVFMKMWLYMLHGGTIDKTRAFLHHVLANAVVDAYRKHKTASLEKLLERGYEPSADDTERWANAIDGRQAFALLDTLPNTYRSVLQNTYARGLSYTEIANMTGSSRNTIAVQVHRGLARLKALFI